MSPTNVDDKLDRILNLVMELREQLAELRGARLLDRIAVLEAERLEAREDKGRLGLVWGMGVFAVTTGVQVILHLLKLQ